MKSSKTGLMNQIRRALFQEEEETDENSQPTHALVGNSLVDHTIHQATTTATVVPSKSHRRGQRQKCSTRSVVAAKKKRMTSSSILADLQMDDDDNSVSTHHRPSSSSSRSHGMSVLAGMEQMSLSSDKPSFRKRAPANSMSVLAGIQENKSISSSRRATTNPQGGFMSMFAAPPTTRTKPQNYNVKTPVVGGLLGAVGVVERKNKNKDVRGAGKRGRPPQAKKRVSWASESSLFSNTITTSSSMSVMAVEEEKPSARSQRAARRGDRVEDSRDDKPTSSGSLKSHSGHLQPSQIAKKGGKASNQFGIIPEKDVASDSQWSQKPAATRNNRRTREKPTTPEKEYTSDADAFMMEDGSPMQVVEESDVPNSETKPAKRVDTKPTPKKVDEVDNDDSMAVSPNVPKSTVRPQENQFEAKTEMEPPSPFVLESRVLEVEYISPSISAKMFQPSPAIQSSTRCSPNLPSSHAPSSAQMNAPEAETTQSEDLESTDTASPRKETRRSRRRPIPTNRFSPSTTTAIQKDEQQQTLELSDSECVDDSLASSPLPMESDYEEPVKRRSARTQMQTDRFSPSVAMKQAQFESEKPPRANKGKKVAHPKKSTISGRPPRKSRNETGAKSVPDSDSSDQQELMDTDTACPGDESNDILTTEDETQSSSASSGEWNDSQLLQLKQAHADVDPTSPTYWSDIALRVQGRTAQECRDKWFSLVKTPAPRARKATRKDPTVDELAAATEAFHLNDDEDDIFNSTPLRGALFPPQRTESPMDCEETIDVDFDVGSPVIMSAKQNRRVSTEYDDGNEKLEFQPKAGYKAYMMGLKRGVSRANQEKKATKSKKGAFVKGGGRTMTESVGNKDVSLKGQLSPGGTLRVKNLTETEDDFLDYLSEPSEYEQY